MIDASSSQVVLRVTDQMLQFARALAVDEGDWAALDFTGVRTAYLSDKTAQGGSSLPSTLRRLPSHVQTPEPSRRGQRWTFHRLVLQRFPVSSWIDTRKTDISSLLPGSCDGQQSRSHAHPKPMMLGLKQDAQTGN